MAKVCVNALPRVGRRLAEAVPAGPPVGREGVLIGLRSLGLMVEGRLVGRAEVDVAKPEGSNRANRMQNRRVRVELV